MDASISRRRLLGGAAAALVLSACRDGERDAGRPPSTSSADPPTTPPTSAATGAGPMMELTATDFEGLGTCKLLPEQTAGPFPLEEQFDRRDITEGYPGQPMRLGFRVVDQRCAPVPGAAVEVWHCDASGDYSGFADGGGGKDEANGTTFLRGTQTANDNGIVEFLTIVPGWYTGRAVHIHLRVHLDDALVLTSQVYVDDDHLVEVYRSPPYSSFGAPDTSITDDAIAGDPEADGSLLRTTMAETSAGPGTLGLLNLGIDLGAR